MRKKGTKEAKNKFKICAYPPCGEMVAGARSTKKYCSDYHQFKHWDELNPRTPKEKK